MSLPAHVTRTLERLTEGVARNEIARRASAISQNYRAGGGSILINTRIDALAYALVRMPATYAAVSASLSALRDVDESFAPASLLDIGAGPGTATWAAAQACGSLAKAALIDANAALRDIATEFTRDNPLFSEFSYRLGDALIELKAPAEADLVIASYAIGELPEDQRAELIDRMWSKTKHTLLIIEPGTPDGYSRIIGARDRLIAAGAHIAAPCTHDHPCPLIAPDWCHFAQRLARSRDHMHLKSAFVPFEDEKFSYIAATRQPVSHAGFIRVLSPPIVSKADIRLKVCEPDGRASIRSVSRRDKEAYAKARRLRWGDIAKTV